MVQLKFLPYNLFLSINYVLHQHSHELNCLDVRCKTKNIVNIVVFNSLLLFSFNNNFCRMHMYLSFWLSIYLYNYLTIYLYTYLYTYRNIYIYIYIYIYTHPHICINIYIYIHTHPHICINIYIYIYIYIKVKITEFCKWMFQNNAYCKCK